MSNDDTNVSKLISYFIFGFCLCSPIDVYGKKIKFIEKILFLKCNCVRYRVRPSVCSLNCLTSSFSSFL